ncbi:hypothetical protein ACHAQH_010037 [Verticillium albo-atrum]
MSQTTDIDNSAAPLAPVREKSLGKDCAVLFGGPSGAHFASGKNFKSGAKTLSRLIKFTGIDMQPYVGFSLEFPLGAEQTANEDAGFGVRHIYDRSGGGQVVVNDKHRLMIKFPRDQCDYNAQEPSDEVLSRFPDAQGLENRGLALLTIKLHEGASVNVTGFGMPFVNVCDPEVESWVNDNKPVVDNITITDVLQQRVFTLLVATQFSQLLKAFDESRLPPPFQYPFGTEHTWDMPRIERVLKETKSKLQFAPAFSYETDNDHVAVVTQAIVQDVMWLEFEAREMRAIKHRGYFVTPEPESEAAEFFYMVIPATKEFRDRYENAWRRLVKNGGMHVLLADEDQEPARWQCEIIHHAGGIDALNDHPTETYDVVLQARRPQPKMPGRDYEIKMFSSREAANEALENASEQ